MAGTKIEDASTTLGSGDITGAEYAALGKTGWADSRNTLLLSLKTWILDGLNKISQGTSYIEVIDTGAGTGSLDFRVEGTDYLHITVADGIVPETDNLLDLGTTTKQFKDLYVNTKAYLDSLELGTGGTVNTITNTVDGGSVATELADAAAIWTAIGASSAARWFTWAGAARTDDATITTATNVVEGTPIRYRATAGTWRYGIVDALAANAHTILGHPCTVADDDEFQYGNPELVIRERIHVAGQFSINSIVVTTAAGLLYDYLNMILQYVWEGATAKIVGMRCSCFTDDSTVDPTVGLSIDIGNTGVYVDVFSPAEIDVDTGGHDTSNTAITANYEINHGDVLDFDVTKVGTGDAADLDITLIYVLD